MNRKCVPLQGAPNGMAVCYTEVFLKGKQTSKEHLSLSVVTKFPFAYEIFKFTDMQGQSSHGPEFREA
jgi:hypothetical protein